MDAHVGRKPDTIAGYVQATYEKQQRSISPDEGPWRREGQLVRIKLIDLEPSLPEGISLDAIQGFCVACNCDGKWKPLPHHIDFCDDFRRWTDQRSMTADTQLCFWTPSPSTLTEMPEVDAALYDGGIDVSLWDARDHARLEGIRVFYAMAKRPGADLVPLEFRESLDGLSVLHKGQVLLRFARDKGWQIDFAARPGLHRNLVPTGTVWRWLLTETLEDLVGNPQDKVTFKPVVRKGVMLVVRVAAKMMAGDIATTLRIFLQSGALVLEFSDYRTVRSRPELPVEQHPRNYAGQNPSPYPGLHYATMTVTLPEAVVFDHLYKFGPIESNRPIGLVYTGERDHRGYNWMALQTPDATVGVAVHGRSHHPDHPFKIGTENGQTVLMLEPFGSIVDERFHSCDHYMIILAADVGGVRDAFDTLDTFPILARIPVRRTLALLDSYQCLCKWVNLNLDYLMKPGRYRNALRTDGTFKNETATCVVAIGEMMRLYEKTGFDLFRTTAEQAAEFVAEWILSGKFGIRGEGLDPNGGGIYQNEQIYLLLSLAQVYRVNRNPRLREAIGVGNKWLYDQRGGKGTWGWADYLWHAGGFDAQGKSLYWWPVNTNQFATLNFRLYQLLGDREFYDHAMEVMCDYIARLPQKSREVIRGGGVSDTTRGVHLFAEAVEVASADPRIDAEFWRRLVEETLDRFWIEGWVQIRNSIYGEVIRSGNDPKEIFSPGFKHFHNVGSYLDIAPRIQAAAELGVSATLTRWAVRDLAYEFDSRFGLEEHTHFSRFGIRDTDIEPACWLDPELLPTLWAVLRRGWIDQGDFDALRWKIHRMIQSTFIPYDQDHGGWAAAYDAHGGQPIKYLAYWHHRHSHERFAPGEAREMWGIAPREAFHDHSTHYWSALEQLIDELLTTETVGVSNGLQTIRFRDTGLAAGIPETRPALVPKAEGATRVAVAAEDHGSSWEIMETRSIRVGGKEFWLLAVDCRNPSS